MTVFRKSALAAMGLGLLALAPASAAQLPRASPDLNIAPPSGKSTMLSTYKGKVVVLEFLFVKSQHCVRVAQMLNTLQSEFGSRGYQSVGVAFDAPNAAATGGDFLETMVDYLKINYPIGYANHADVDNYLGRSGNEMLSIPQIVVIDRAGMIRAATGAHENLSLEDVNALRMLLDTLLRESPPAASAK
jgi:peroxiredoxin